MIPPIWFLEINRINVKLGRAPLNQTEGEELKSMIEKGLISKANLNDKTVCFVFQIFKKKFFFIFKIKLKIQSTIGFSYTKGEMIIIEKKTNNHSMMHDYINIFF
jgi:hypothetical protein